MVESEISPGNKLYEENTTNEIWIKQKQKRQEYMQKLKNWLDEARLSHFNICAGLPFNGTGNAEYNIHNVYDNLVQANLLNRNVQNVLNRRLISNFHTSGFETSTQPPSTYEFVIPPLWKRAVAELMDFLLLFLLKMALTFVLLESFDIIDMGFYGFESFQKNLENSEVAMPMAMELLTLELLHRVIVCAYEIYFLKGKFCATPGKRYMGLMVIAVDTVSPLSGRLPETVVATGAAPLGWQKSLIRAAMKNLFVGLFLPLCVAFYIFPHNRTSYDMMSNSIVIEYHQEFLLYNDV